ncbi:hypothetical protein KGF56_001527 [Candida oxycetoniae]|uniref:Uncharacterized protein n=1 Tax=Candida oxycetoniae TaxID=497107 RepID=A0AAI9SYZ5_9ASCO|nr:uncharacterized protein KGF56_001527 [Candida oxycetoniae]KAI3405509.2 hypothetical protein KGF56_001527 [Candida oxycetoniae]
MIFKRRRRSKTTFGSFQEASIKRVASARNLFSLKKTTPTVASLKDLSTPESKGDEITLFSKNALVTPQTASSSSTTTATTTATTATSVFATPVFAPPFSSPPSSPPPPSPHSPQSNDVPDTKTFEDDSLLDFYSPRKAVKIDQTFTLDSICASLDRLDVVDELDVPASPISCHSNTLSVSFNDILSSSTTRQNSLTKDTEAMSITNANIQIYQHAHDKSKSNNLRLVKDLYSRESPKKSSKVSYPNIHTYLEEENENAGFDELHRLEMLLLDEKHKYELKQHKREINILHEQLRTQRMLIHQLSDKLRSYESDSQCLLPPFKVVQNNSRSSISTSTRDSIMSASLLKNY